MTAAEQRWRHMMRLSAVLGAGGLVLQGWSLFLPRNSGMPPTAPVVTSTGATADVVHVRALFAVKGCATCHNHSRVSEAQGMCCGGVGPDLTSYTNDPVFLRRWLADPAAVRPGTHMPNLNLSPTEIEHLIAFLNTSR